MKQGSTLILRGAIILIGALALTLCAYVLPIGIRAEDADGYRPILLGLYAPAIPFFWALNEAMKLLSYIDKNQAFSDLSVKGLNKIKNCALIISGLFIAGMPYIYMVAEKDDAPGVILIGLVITGASLVIATFAAVLQKLLGEALTIKSENDLTV